MSYVSRQKFSLGRLFLDARGLVAVDSGQPTAKPFFFNMLQIVRASGSTTI